MVKINWIGFAGVENIRDLLNYGTRFNSGVPYSFFRIGPIIIKKYL